MVFLGPNHTNIEFLVIGNVIYLIHQHKRVLLIKLIRFVIIIELIRFAIIIKSDNVWFKLSVGCNHWLI